jgi:hypothetical protein
MIMVHCVNGGRRGESVAYTPALVIEFTNLQGGNLA